MQGLLSLIMHEPDIASKCVIACIFTLLYVLSLCLYCPQNLCIQANPQWREQFDFNHFEDNQEPLQVEVCSKRGRKGEESWGM